MTADLKAQLAAVRARIAALQPQEPRPRISVLRAELAQLDRDLAIEEALRIQHGDRPRMMDRAWLEMRRRRVLQDIDAVRAAVSLVEAGEGVGA